MWVLGINWRWHDGAACVVDETGRVVAFAEEERFVRRRHAVGEPPSCAAAFCLDAAGISAADVDVVAVGWDLPRIYPRVYDVSWDHGDEQALLGELFGGNPAQGAEVIFVPHHRAHALSAFYSSGFDRSAVLVVDGHGEDESTSIYDATFERGLVRRATWSRADSIGYIYDAASRALGYTFLEAGKTMGLSAYGRARGVEPWRLVDIDDAGNVCLAVDTSNRRLMYPEGFMRWSAVFERLAGEIRRRPWELDQDEAAVRVAWSAQHAVEQAVAALATSARATVGDDRLCLSGGVAMNCVANGLLDEPVFVPPFPHDAGVALGAAWAVCPPRVAAQISPYLGLDAAVGVAGIVANTPHRVEPFSPESVAARLERGQIGGIVQGRAEVGARALGHRSIVALPSADIDRRLNRLKGREPWRPFAPVTATPWHDGQLWEAQGARARYMTGSSVVTDRGRRALPGAVHVDGTTRPQVVAPGEASVLRAVLAAIGGQDAVLVNTSFNGPGEPIVNSAVDAHACFTRLGLDFLVLEEILLTKEPI